MVQCLCELPESYEAYRKQQHRWHSGPMQLFRLCLPDIVKSKVSWEGINNGCTLNFIFLFDKISVIVLLLTRGLSHNNWDKILTWTELIYWGSMFDAVQWPYLLLFLTLWTWCLRNLSWSLCGRDVQISVGKKANLIFLFFLLRKLILPFYSFALFCVILPMTMFVPEAKLPVWVVCYIPAIMSLMNILPSPRSFPFLIPYLLFENTMSVTKFQAMVSGLFQLSSSFEWVVTKKSGRASEADLIACVQDVKPQSSEQLHKLARVTSESGLDALKKKHLPVSVPAPPPSLKRKRNRLYWNELALACLLLTAAARSLLSEQGVHFYFLLFQGISFLVVGLDLIGEQVS